MKKNAKKTASKKVQKSQEKSWVALIVSFVLGAVIGILVYANLDSFSFSAPLNCPDGTPTDKHGCCAGEVYTEMGDLGSNCCPESGGDCFPPIK
jgi:hypothetical protein